MKVKIQKSVRVKFQDRNTIELVVHDVRTDSWTCFHIHLQDESVEEVEADNAQVQPAEQDNSSETVVSEEVTDD